MRINRENRRSGHVSLAAILLTAVLTLCAAGATAWYAGLIFPRAPVQRSAGDEKETLYTCGMHPQIIRDEPGNCPICGMELVPVRREETTGAGTGGERKIAYWRAPMNPNEIYDQPGKSAMGMDLVPVYEDELVGGVHISIDPAMVQNMGIRTELAKQGPLVHTIRTYGHVTYDETRMARVNLRFSGWIEKLYVDFTGMQVKRGDPMFDFYSPELITAQQDLLEAYRNLRRRADGTNRKVLESVKNRLRYYGIADAEIEAILRQDAIRQVLTIRAPYTGVVTQKNALEGDFVKTGTTIYEIADLSKVWVEAHIYEYELAWVEKGLPAEMTLPYLPGKAYVGEVAYVYPYLQRSTRDVVVRLEFDNPHLSLKPDMYGDVRIRTSPGETGIYVPESAVLRSGERNIVFVRRERGKFTPREVVLGMPLDDNRIQVLQGIAPGERVVTSGQFMLDSESKLREGAQKMTEPETPPAGEQAGKDGDFFSDMEAGGDEADFFKDLE